MKQEYSYLIALCRSYLSSEAATLRTDIDYQRLYQIANSHNLSAIVFCVLNTAHNKEVVAREAFKRFEDDFYEAIIRYDMQQALTERLTTLLSEHSIRHVFFKGAELKEYYPVPQARVMSDVDLLIAPEDRDRVKELLSKNGIRPVHTNGPVYEYTADGFKTEVHTKIISGKVGNSDAEQCFSDAMEYADFTGFRGTLQTDYHFAYLITHIAHHFWFYGAGVKLILDLAVMLRTFEVDLDRVLDKLREEGLDTFGKVLLSVCYRWFGNGQDYGLDTEQTEAFLLSFGAFGNVNRSTAAVIERKELEEGKVNSSFASRLRLLFPSYQQVKNIPYIRFIEGRPYLLPYAWLYRIAYNFKYKRDYITHTAKQIGSDETHSKAQRELAYFKEIGLL